MQGDAGRVAPNLYFVLASRHLERIADHATNIAEDIIFWVRGLEVRHGRAKQSGVDSAAKGDPQIKRNALILAKTASASAKSAARAGQRLPIKRLKAKVSVRTRFS